MLTISPIPTPTLTPAPLYAVCLVELVLCLAEGIHQTYVMKLNRVVEVVVAHEAALPTHRPKWCGVCLRRNVASTSATSLRHYHLPAVRCGQGALLRALSCNLSSLHSYAQSRM